MHGSDDASGDDDWHRDGTVLDESATAATGAPAARTPGEMVPYTLPGGAYARPSVRFTGLAIVAVALAAALILLTLPRPAVRTARPLATGTSTLASVNAPAPATAWEGSSLPAFHDWRVAYLALDGAVHAVTADGTRDVEGPVLPGLDASTLLRPAGTEVSPNGRFLAYLAASTQAPGVDAARTLVVVDLASRQPARVLARAETARAVALFWSPDSAHLAYQDVVARPSSIAIIDVRNGAIAALPWPFGDRNPVILLAGWIDAAHLAVLVFWPATPTASQPGTPGSATFGALDLASGAFRAIATLPPEPIVHVAPDGRHAVVQDSSHPGAVEVVETATGQMRQLPTISHAAGGLFFKAAWQPGAQVVAVNTSGSGPESPRALLLDLGKDEATWLPSDGEVLGWAPDGGPLIISSVGNALRAVSPIPQYAQSFQYVALTQAAVAFLGFIRTA